METYTKTCPWCNKVFTCKNTCGNTEEKLGKEVCYCKKCFYELYNSNSLHLYIFKLRIKCNLLSSIEREKCKQLWIMSKLNGIEYVVSNKNFLVTGILYE